MPKQLLAQLRIATNTIPGPAVQFWKQTLGKQFFDRKVCVQTFVLMINFCTREQSTPNFFWLASRQNLFHHGIVGMHICPASNFGT